jgi:hypothetical protein
VLFAERSSYEFDLADGVVIAEAQPIAALDDACGVGNSDVFGAAETENAQDL